MLNDTGEIIATDVRGDEHILWSDEKLQVFETVRSVDGIGTYRAWNIADYFESYKAFEDADSATFDQVDGIAPGLAVEFSSLQ
jgi:excinuclease UvrABC nuclease subunit